MNRKQYNNVIDYTLKHEPSVLTGDSLATARAIFSNMGVALPRGEIKEVYETIKTDNFMGWKSCSMQEAQVAADNGTAAIGINEERIVVLSAIDEEEPVTATATVMSLSKDTSTSFVDGLQYYSYSCGSTGQCGCGSPTKDVHSNSLFNCNNRTDLLNDLIAIMGNEQDSLSLHTTTECVDIVLKYDSIITEYCNKYCVPKEFVQTLLLRELWCVDLTDEAADKAVIAYFGWKVEYEYWSQMPDWQKIFISMPSAPMVMKEDSSTGIGQMFASVAINAHNLAISKGLINENCYNANDWHDCAYVWNKLHDEDEFAIKMTTLEMHHCADCVCVCGSLFDCTDSQIKAILARYNGTGSEAASYGDACYKYYKIFKKYS